MKLEPYNHEWVHPNPNGKYQSGCEENLWWWKFWNATHENQKRFAIHESVRNTDKWDFEYVDPSNKYSFYNRGPKQ